MQTLRICDVGLSTDASHAFHSMLKIVDGRSVASWRHSDIDQADVLLAYASGRPDSGVPGTWAASGKPAMLLIDDRASWPASQFVLRYPFRVMQLLSLLDSVAEHLHGRPTRMEREDSAWAAAESMRELTSRADDRGWHVARAPDDVCLWVSEGHAYASEEALRGLRDGSLVFGAFAATGLAPPPQTPRWARGDIAWFIGAHGPTPLAPWLRPDVAYRLRRWPDFGRLGAMPHMIELSAQCASHAQTPAELSRRSGYEPAEVHRFLAAASLAGLLTSSARVDNAERRAPSAPVKRGWTRFVADLRRHFSRVA